jgi:hypothetical protein
LPGDRPPPITGGLSATEEPDTISASGTVISLDKEAERERLSVADHVALQDANLRQRVAYWTIGTFIGANLVTLFALGYLASLDQSNIASKLITPGDRIITSQVFMALLGATTVQVGAIMVIIARYLFPDRP